MKIPLKRLIPLLLTTLFAASLPCLAMGPRPTPGCTPTPTDAQGPFYREGAPVRSKVGEGYLLSGKVLSAANCSPVAGARIEIWTTGPDGDYDDRWRATNFSGRGGGYSFESHFPGPYGSRPPHIHIIVAAPGFRELVTQHYPVRGKTGGSFDLVLVPER
ncbi:hypothetical protein [Desulfuromonas sp.]|uniref:dioxygenase family protein n=1 Tax=Desulfuromonas sp. TaxID=892 RepID=UPI0025C53D5B|nr:hypothetical protein [Desulfuromonas sp.]